MCSRWRLFLRRCCLHSAKPSLSTPARPGAILRPCWLLQGAELYSCIMAVVGAACVRRTLHAARGDSASTLTRMPRLASRARSSRGGTLTRMPRLASRARSRGGSSFCAGAAAPPWLALLAVPVGAAAVASAAAAGRGCARICGPGQSRRAAGPSGPLWVCAPERMEWTPTQSYVMFIDFSIWTYTKYILTS